MRGDMYCTQRWASYRPGKASLIMGLEAGACVETSDPQLIILSMGKCRIFPAST